MDAIRSMINRDHHHPHRITATLKADGFRLLGCGACTATYGKPRSPYVVKINKHSDPAAYKFYSMISGRRSRYFPKVHLLRTYVDAEGSFLFVAVMERLHELHRTWRRTNSLGRGFASWVATLPYASIQSVGDDYKPDAELWAKHNRSHVKIVNDVLEATVQFAEPDLFDGNLMVRLPQGDVVLNDPICTVR